MAGETAKTEAVCLDIRPWSQTSHITKWITPSGPVTTIVKGAVRPKSAFLGQYDLNYTCEIIYYLRSRGDAHALREASPVKLRERLRNDFRALALAGHMRRTIAELAPSGTDAEEWFETIDSSLDRLAEGPKSAAGLLQIMLRFELKTLALAGLAPEIEAEKGVFSLKGERKMAISPEVAKCIRNPLAEKNCEILVDTARAIGVFYQFHLDCALDARRTALRMISNQNQGKQADEH